jgi:hypothetical protein
MAFFRYATLVIRRRYVQLSAMHNANSDVSRYLGSIERGAVSASVTVLGRLAQALRIDPWNFRVAAEIAHSKN